jgi:hypothetical protein
LFVCHTRSSAYADDVPSGLSGRPRHQTLDVLTVCEPALFDDNQYRAQRVFGSHGGYLFGSATPNSGHQPAG